MPIKRRLLAPRCAADLRRAFRVEVFWFRGLRVYGEYRVYGVWGLGFAGFRVCRVLGV